MVATTSAQNPTVLCEMQIRNHSALSAPQDPLSKSGIRSKR